MSTSRSALQLLREEPTLVGAVLYLFAIGAVKSAGAGAMIPLGVFADFVGAADPFEIWSEPEKWPRLTKRGVGYFISQPDLREWLGCLSSDRSDFAPAVPRALPGGRA